MANETFGRISSHREISFLGVIPRRVNALAGFLIAVILSIPASADQVASQKFVGLNNNESSVIIGPEYAQDLLNVDVTPGGLSIKKRFGYGVYKASGSGSAIHGGSHFYDSTGNDVQVFGTGTTFYAVVNDGTPTVIVSSATTGSTWDCADTQGSAYCVNSNRDLFLRTNGATKTWYGSPLGTMVESTPDRVVVAGVSGSPNTLFVSQSNTFTNYVTGPLATDAFTEVIASPGSKLTNIRWGCGKLLWWKDQSFGYFDFDDQFAAQVKTVSDIVGTLDNTSAIDPGGQVWFRGQDGHTYKYDCSILTKESIDITPNVQTSGRRTSNSWTQSSQSDFAAGASSQVVTISTTVSPGDVTVGTFTATDTTFAGTTSNTTVTGSSVTLAVNSSNAMSDPSFEGGGTPPANWVNSGATNWAAVNSNNLYGCTVNPQSGSWMASAIGFTNSGNATYLTATIEDMSGTTLATKQQLISTAVGCQPYTQLSIPSTGFLGKRVKIRFRTGTADLTNIRANMVTDAGYILGTDVTFYYASADDAVGLDVVTVFVDNVCSGGCFSSITTGSYTSQAFDTGLAYSYVYPTTTWTVNTATPLFVLQKGSSTTGGWQDVGTSTGTNYAVNKRYVRYISTFTITSADSAFSALTGVTFVAASSGTYYSAVHNAPNISGWSTLGVNTQLNNGTETFYMRADTNPINVTQSTPSWTAQTAGSLVTIATGTYFQFRDDFAITAATQTPTLNDFTINWFEGSAGDQAYMTYFDNAIWESVAFGAGQSVNNAIFKYDLINEGWTVYSFGAGGLWLQSNTLYFGDTSSGNIFNYGTVKSDNGTAISAYWKTKDFGGQDPYLANALTNIDTFAKKDQGSTLTAAYTLDTSTNSTSYSIPLSSATSSIIQSRKLLPGGKNGYTFNLKYSDSSASSQWEILGFRVGYSQIPYRSTP